MIRRLSLLLLSLLFAASPLAGAEAGTAPRPVLASEGTAYVSLETREFVYPDKATLTYGPTVLTADEIRYSQKDGRIVARGHVVMTRGARRLLTDTLTFRLADESFETDDLRFGQHPFFVSGAKAAGTRDTLAIEHATVTSPEPGPFIPTVSAERLTVGADRHVQAESPSAGIGRTLPFSFGTFRHTLTEPLLSNVSLAGGYRSSLGVFVDAGLLLPVNDTLKIGGDLGLYSARGVMFGPAARYERQDGDTGYRGSFRSGYIHDSGTRYADLLGVPVPADRGYVEWTHDQKLTDALAITAQLNYWHDSEVLRDFRPRSFFSIQQPDTFVEAVYVGDNYFVSAFVRAAPNDFQVVQERLPELRFDLLPTALPLGFYERFEASYAALRDASPTDGTVLRADRLDAYYAISRPFAHADWFTFTPMAGARITHYGNTEGAARSGGYTRKLGELGFDAQARFSGTFDVKSERWKIDGLRHLLTPKLSYRYIPEADAGTPYIPAIDRESFLTYLPPLGLGDTRNLDHLHSTNTFRFGFDNTLQTRDPAYGSRDLVVLNVAADARLDRALGERKLSQVHAEVGLMPARWLELGAYTSFTPQDLTLQQFNTGITLRDGDAWAVRFASNLLRRELEDYHVEATWKFNEAFSALTRLRYDARKERFNEQAYGIRQNLANTWSIDYVVTIYDGNRRESNFGLNVRIEALRF